MSLLASLRVLACALLVALHAAASSAIAQPPSDDREAEVRVLFEEGVALVDAERWEEAEDRFRRCLALRRSPVLEYNLASALAAQGELVEAAGLLGALLETPTLPDGLRLASADLLARVAPRLAHLTIRISGEAEGTELSIDGAPIATSRLGERIPIDPGPHRIEARGEAGVSVDAVVAREGESVTVQLVLAAPRGVASAAPAARPAPLEALVPEPAERARRPRAWLFSALGVVVAAGAATAVALTVDREAAPTRSTLPPIVIARMGRR